jgi:hypothetical protein
MYFDYANIVEDPAYGTRIFRRRIRLEKRGTSIAAGLEDIMHACKLIVDIDGDTIVDVHGTWYRHPNTSCRGAIAQFAPYIGKKLTAHRPTFRGYADPRQQCTHFHDLLGLVMNHGLRDEAVRQFDITIPDMVDEKTWAEVHVNGELFHHWEINRDGILGPAPLAGRTLTSGFSRWAAETYSGDALEAARVLQMGIFVSWAGNLDFKAMAMKRPGEVLAPTTLFGACYALQPERTHEAFPCHEIRDFTNSADRMLEFL